MVSSKIERYKYRLMSAVVLMVLHPTSAWAQGKTAKVAKDAAKAKEELNPLPTWEEFLTAIFDLKTINLSWGKIIGALLVVLLGFFLRTYLLDRLLRPFEAIASKTETAVDEELIESAKRPLGWLFNVLAFYLAVVLLQLPKGLNDVLVLLLRTVGTIVLAWLLYNGVAVLVKAMESFAQSTESEIDDHLVPLIQKLLRVVIVIVTVVMIIQQWGYDVTSLIAGLGLGGLAFALAAKDTLANWFGSVMIFTDRPFKIGDWIKTKHGEGVVEDIGLRSTKIRTFSKSLITVPNSDVATTSVENFSQMTSRRIKANIGLTYGTTSAQIERIVDRIRELFLESDDFVPEAWYVNFSGFGDSSLDIMLYCFTNTVVYAEFLEIRQKLFFDIMAIVEEEGSGFAFPSQSIYIEESQALDRLIRS